MAMSVDEIRAWLDSLDENAIVGVDDGGLCLQVVGDPDTYCEIGGIPEDEDTEDD